MRVPTKLLALLAFSLVLLSAIAMWYDVLQVNTVVTTGSVDIDVKDLVVEEGDEFGKPWVASCSADVLDKDDGSVTVSITLGNAYPGYSCTVKFKSVNAGTIPVIGPYYTLPEVPRGIDLYVSEVKPRQLHPGEHVEHAITVRVKQEAEESSEYTVVVEMEFVQWNEAPLEPLATTISGRVFEDLDGDGKWDEGEGYLEGVYVELLRNDVVVGSACTDEYGYYSFLVYPLRPTTYTIKVYPLPGYELTTPRTITLTVLPGYVYPGNDFGMRPTPPPPTLKVSKDFRHTDFKTCQIGSGLPDPLEREDGFYVVKAIVQKGGPFAGRVTGTAPGAFYGVIWVEGQGIRQISITDTYGPHFDVKDGQEGRVQVFILNKTTMCLTELPKEQFNYSVDNENNVVTVHITLDQPLGADQAVLVFLKYKPAIVNMLWSDVVSRYGVYFENRVSVGTNIGSAEASATIKIVPK